MRSETNSARFKHPSRVDSRRTEHTLLVTRYIMLLLSMKINNNFFWFPTKASISMTLIAEGAGHDMPLNEDGGERRMEWGLSHAGSVTPSFLGVFFLHFFYAGVLPLITVWRLSPWFDWQAWYSIPGVGNLSYYQSHFDIYNIIREPLSLLCLAKRLFRHSVYSPILPGTAVLWVTTIFFICSSFGYP